MVLKRAAGKRGQQLKRRRLVELGSGRHSMLLGRICSTPRGHGLCIRSQIVLDERVVVETVVVAGVAQIGNRLAVERLVGVLRVVVVHGGLELTNVVVQT